MHTENAAAMIANLVDMLSYTHIVNDIPETDPQYARAMMIVINNVETCHPIGEG